MLTSVDRDDLPDGGARHYADCIRAIKARCPQTAVEALTPDFAGNLADVATVVDSGLDVFAQNLETVERLTTRCATRVPATSRRCRCLRTRRRYRPNVLTKTSLMLGLGETEDEILATLDDLKRACVDIVTFGQYLRPTPNHLAVERYVTPQEFEQLSAVGPRARFPRGRRRARSCARAIAPTACSRRTTWVSARGERVLSPRTGCSSRSSRRSSVLVIVVIWPSSRRAAAGSAKGSSSSI